MYRCYRERERERVMGFDQDKKNTPLKLSLFSLPSQSPEPSGMLTPPLRTSASVPFHWEEAPGKPRSYMDGTTAPKAARTLDLPPRLAKITQTPSPTAVLDGPYELPRASKGPERSFGGNGQVGGEKRGLGSWRWGSVKESSREWRGVFDFSYSVGRRSRSESDFSKARIVRVRKRSFFGSSKSHTWASFYESVKQAVRWRR